MTVDTIKNEYRLEFIHSRVADEKTEQSNLFHQA
jgi:hypothetical protein